MMHFYFSDSSFKTDIGTIAQKKVRHFSQSDVKKYILNIMKRQKIKNIRRFLCLLAWVCEAAVKVRVSN